MLYWADKAHALDLRRRKLPMNQPTIPLQPAEFDKAVVQALIRTRHPDVSVSAATLVDAATSTSDDTRVSTAQRVTVDVVYDGGDVPSLPTRLTVKIAKPGLGDIPLYDNEVNVYKRLADELPVLAPQCVGAVRDKANSSFALAMEDLRVKGCTFPTVLTPTGPEEVKVILDQLAALHAHYWESPRFETDMTWVQPHTDGPIHDMFSHDAGVPMLVAWEVQSQQFKRELVESVGESADSLRRKVTAVQEHQATLSTTLVHGDCHIGNTFLLPDGRRGLLDWQLAARGYCMHDVGYLIITALSVKDRRIHEDELLKHYQRSLSERGISNPPTVEDLRDEYRMSAAWCFYIGWLTTPVENYGWEINVANQIRLATAYRDLDSKAAIESRLFD